MLDFFVDDDVIFEFDEVALEGNLYPVRGHILCARIEDDGVDEPTVIDFMIEDIAIFIPVVEKWIDCNNVRIKVSDAIKESPTLKARIEQMVLDNYYDNIRRGKDDE